MYHIAEDALNLEYTTLLRQSCNCVKIFSICTLSINENGFLAPKDIRPIKTSGLAYYP